MVETTMEYREDVIIKLKLSLLELNEEIWSENSPKISTSTGDEEIFIF
jgi:hypothetical protein